MHRNGIADNSLDRFLETFRVAEGPDADELAFQNLGIGDGRRGQLRQGAGQGLCAQPGIVGRIQLARRGTVKIQRLAQADIERNALGPQAPVGIHDALADAQREIHVVADGLREVLKIPAADGTDVHRRHGAQGQGHRARADRIPEVVRHCHHFGADHGLQHVVQAADRQIQGFLDFGETQAFLVHDQQVEDIEGAQIAIGTHDALLKAACVALAPRPSAKPS